MGKDEIKSNIDDDGKLTRLLPALLLAAIILCLSAYMVYWGTQKEGFHIDEMFSLMSIRGGNLDRPYEYNEFFNVWLAASELESTVGVTAENAFSAAGTLGKPYLYMLHIAYSLRPDGFSVWPSMAFNLLFYAGCLIIIYLLSRIFIDNKYLALLPGLAWGLSSAAVNLVLFIRFYTLKTFLCLLLTYFVFIAVKNGFGKWRYLVAIAAITGAGALIHQYFLVYAFFLTVFACIYLLAKREYKSLLKFSGMMAAGAAAYQIYTGFGISYIFSGAYGRAEEAVENLIYGSEGYAGRIQAYFSVVSEAIFGNVSIYIVFAFIIATALIVCMSCINKGAGLPALLKKQKVSLWIVLCLTVLFYLLMIARIAPYQEIRYVFCITPFIVILFISLLISAFKAAGFKSTVTVFLIVAVLSLLLPIGNIRKFNLHWDAVKTDEKLASYYHLPVVCISNRKLDTAVCYWQLFEFEDKVLFAITGIVDIGAISEMQFDDGLIVMFQSPEGDGDVEAIMDATGLDSYAYVTDLVRHTVYYLEKNEHSLDKS